MRKLTISLAVITLACLGARAHAQDPEEPETLKPAPKRRADEGKGPFKTMVIRGAMLIDGTGGPPRGPVDIVIEGNHIAAVKSAGTPGLPPKADRDPKKADFEIDATGQYVLPGFVDLHVHGGSKVQNEEAEYAYKLWLGHGVTTVRGVSLASQTLASSEQKRSAANEIVAPRMFNYQFFGTGWGKPFPDTPEAAREWMRWAGGQGVDGVKLGAFRPEIMAAVLDEAKKLNMGSVAHLDQGGVGQMNAIKAARLGLGTVTHFYGHFESLLKDTVVQPWPVNQNNNNEYQRFGQVARLWDKIYPQGSPEWKEYLEEHLKLGTTFDPTFTIYSAGRDLMKFRYAPWHEKYTLPSLMDFYSPSRVNHGAYWYDWTTEDEVAFRNFYQVWFRLMNDYKKIGGRVTTGSDSGFIYQTYGFGYINELEMLQEAGFHPLEVIQSATMNGALTIHEPKKKPIEFGVVRAGLLADLIIVPENPLQNFKTLYGIGALYLNDKTGKEDWKGGVKYTIKDGIVYDAKQLLADVAAMVEKQKKERAAKK